MLFGPQCVDTTNITASMLCLFLWILGIAILIRALSSWFNVDPRSPIMQALHSITEPVLEPFRRIIPRLGMIDISPMVAILAIWLGSVALQNLVIDLGMP